jgi:hypothetical protein
LIQVKTLFVLIKHRAQRRGTRSFSSTRGHVLRCALLALFAAAAVLAAGASAPAIGFITASGHFTVQGSQFWGNATLFDGATVETGAASSELALPNGVKVQLGARSRARVYATHLALEAGTGQVAAPVAAGPAFSEHAVFEVDAAGLAVWPATAGSRVRVGVARRVEVAALAGSARVSGRNGVLLASIPAGRRMSFAFQAAQNGALTRTGCLVYKDGHYVLQDENTQEIVELLGPDLRANLGNRVQVIGTASTTKPDVTPATSVMNVSSVSPQQQGGCLVVASTLGARTDVPAAGAPGGAPQAPAPVAKTGGMSTGAKVGIVAAIAGGGAGAAIALAGGKKSTSP